MRKDNRGFSLVELIIVMAIMAILTGALMLGVGVLSGKPAEECATKIYQTIQSNRMTAMGKTTASISIYSDDGKIWAYETVNGVDGTPVKIGDKGVKVQFRITGDGAEAWRELGNSSSPLVISFNRSNGSFKDLTDMGITGYCEQIRCTKASTDKRITLYYLTGKISME